MRRIFPGLVLIAVLTTVGAAAAHSTATSSSKRGDRCARRGTVTLLRNREVRVYKFRRNGRKVACGYAKRRRITLEDRPGGIYAYPRPAIALAGPLVAWATDEQIEPTDPIYTFINVVNMRTYDPNTGRPAIPAIFASPTELVARVGSVVVDSRASTAWITCPIGTAPANGSARPNCVHTGANDTVWAHAPGAAHDQSVVLDQGRAIDPRSLRRHGSTVSWTNNGQTKSAPLP